jgi:signal transduction histidine kinase
MHTARSRKPQGVLENYCSRLGVVLEHRYSALVLLQAKREAEKAALAARDAMEKAQTADRAKTKFLSNMAHELRTPLNAIIGFSEIIHSDTMKFRENYQEYAGYIHDAGVLLLRIINDILDLARIEAGKIGLEDESVELDKLMRSVITMVQPVARQKSIAVHLGTTQVPMQLQVDCARFQQIVLNLLSNAVKFTHPGGRIEIIVGLEPGGGLSISIRDTGIGIPPDKLEQVFEPFEQLEDYLTRKNDGTGLGLAITKSLVEMHGGELVLRSDVGKGTTATLRLPADRVHPLLLSAA